MDAPDRPQLYLISPPQFDLGTYPETLARVLDAHDIACVRLSLTSQDEDRLSRAADALRDVTHARDVALVMSDHAVLAERLGLDGVHLGDAARSVRALRKDMGADAIIGSFCGISRHDGMTAAEAGADYVCFGPARASSLGDGSFAAQDIFEWWSQMIEVPVVAEGALDRDTVAALAPHTDFFAIGAEIWDHDDPVAALADLTAPLS